MNISTWTTQEFYDFLEALDNAADIVEVTDWEANFIESVMNQIEERDFISEKQKKIVQNLYTKYNDELDWLIRRNT